MYKVWAVVVTGNMELVGAYKDIYEAKFEANSHERQHGEECSVFEADLNPRGKDD